MTIDGPREIADVREAFGWLAGRADVSDTRIGAWGISYGGGAVWNAIVAGVPFAAAETCETWTDLYSALVPQDLSKSGAVTGFLTEITGSALSRARVVQDVGAYVVEPPRAARVRGRALGAAAPRLGDDSDDVMMQGRRDFAFGIEQATRAYSDARRAEGAVDRQPRARAFDVPGGGHAGDDDGGQDVVRPPSAWPARRHRAAGAPGARGNGEPPSVTRGCRRRRRSRSSSPARGPSSRRRRSCALQSLRRLRSRSSADRRSR